ncbi:MAG: prephenate dehydrogenase/arogenate dehydrogenase family protein [Burkholderiaceae bacterium]|nr:prephenate dehydrogenase/arogenate dehydrogenase family protein [Burkholderiaceae bacterium]
MSDDAPAFARVAVLGIGLVGGSFAAALRAREMAARIVGFSPGGDAERARSLGLIDAVATSPARAVDGADLVVLAAPIPALPGLFGEIAPDLGSETLVTDCASTKKSTIAAARSALGAAYPRFVAGHPIAGGERRGPDASRADLFEGGTVILCPQPQTSPQACDTITRTWRALGSTVVRLEAHEHDALYAEVSHWPHALGFALCAAIASGERAETALRLAGAGLRDTTRIAASPAALWADIVLDNREAVLECARAFEHHARAVTDAIREGDRAALLECFELAGNWRRRMP